MKARDLFSLCLVGAIAWIAWLVARQYRDTVTLRASLLDGVDRSALRSQIWSTQKQIAVLEGQLSPEGQGRRGQGSESLPADGALDAPPSREEMRQRYLALLRDPKFRALQDIAVRARIQQDFAALFRQLHLPEDQQRALEDRAVERVNVAQDVMLSASDQGIDPQTDPKGFAAALKAATDQEDQKIKALIGDQAFSQAVQYVASAPQRAVVSELQQSLSYTPTPLTDDQAAQLVQLLSANKASPSPVGSLPVVGRVGPGVMGGPGGPGGAMASASVLSDTAVTLSASVLSGPQVEALRQVQQVQQAQQRLGQRFKQAQGSR